MLHKTASEWSSEFAKAHASCCASASSWAPFDLGLGFGVATSTLTGSARETRDSIILAGMVAQDRNESGLWLRPGLHELRELRAGPKTSDRARGAPPVGGRGVENTGCI